MGEKCGHGQKVVFLLPLGHIDCATALPARLIHGARCVRLVDCAAAGSGRHVHGTAAFSSRLIHGATPFAERLVHSTASLSTRLVDRTAGTFGLIDRATALAMRLIDNATAAFRLIHCAATCTARLINRATSGSCRAIDRTCHKSLLLAPPATTKLVIKARRGREVLAVSGITEKEMCRDPPRARPNSTPNEYTAERAPLSIWKTSPNLDSFGETCCSIAGGIHRLQLAILAPRH
jgi:hypothetical protein